MRRTRMTKSGSKRLFKATAGKTMRVNLPSITMRGGIRF